MAESKFHDQQEEKDECVVSGAIGKNTLAISVAEELLEFKSREDSFAKFRACSMSKTQSKLASKRGRTVVKKKVPTLVQICLEELARNFENEPVLFGLPGDLLRRLTRILPLDLDVSVASMYVTDENYWKRRCLANRSWKNRNIVNHGLLWKQMFFERTLQDSLEEFNPATDSFVPIQRLLAASGDHVFRLEVNQLISHLDLTIILEHLPNLAQLELQYGVRQIGMQYERSLFGMKISDATSLATCLKATNTLTSLSLPCNHIDDDLLRMLMTGLSSNCTVTHLDLSHNKITDHGARLLAKLLEINSVLTSLNLCDNQIHMEGGRYIGKGLELNASLAELNLRLNRLTDEGGCILFEGLRDNKTLTTINVCSNSLGPATTHALGDVLSTATSQLCMIDMSCNEIEEADCEVLLEAIRGNQNILSLDLRMNKMDDSCRMMEDIQRIVRDNELTGKPKSKIP